jgi:predicted nucleic acid-binding protein
MSHFFDTSLLVAAFDQQDTHHDRARPVFARHASGASIATHTLAETFSILTGRRGWRASDACEMLRTNTAPIDKVDLPSTEYLQVMDKAEALGIRGGAIYDALILACARRAKASVIWTFNPRHFNLFAADLTSKIREP